MSETSHFSYTVVRYHYDQIRDEAINVGVILQGPEGIIFRVIDEPNSLHRAYPFLDVEDVKRKTESLAKTLSRGRISVFDYEKGERIELSSGDPRLLERLPQVADQTLGFTTPRGGESPAAVQPQLPASLDYLYRKFVEPPRPRHVKGIAHEGIARPTHAVLHRAAKNVIVRAARKTGILERCQLEPAVRGKTRTWHLDLKHSLQPMFVHHILVLPNLEETYLDTAALARIWQDVQATQKNGRLAAVYFSKNGTPKSELRAAERLLKQDQIQPLYADELEHYYREELGQRRLINRPE